VDLLLWLPQAGVIGGCIVLVRMVVVVLLRQLNDYREAYEAERKRNDVLATQIMQIVAAARLPTPCPPAASS